MGQGQSVTQTAQVTRVDTALLIIILCVFVPLTIAIVGFGIYLWVSRAETARRRAALVDVENARIDGARAGEVDAAALQVRDAGNFTDYEDFGGRRAREHSGARGMSVNPSRPPPAGWGGSVVPAAP